MLESIRKNASESVVLKVLFGIIALVFVFFYVGTAGFSQLEVAAKVNDQMITKRDFDRAFGNLDRFYRNTAPDNMPPATEMGQQALTQLINTELLVQEAGKLGLAVDEQELRDSIAAMPDFQVDGRFNKTRYLETLQMIGMKPSDFENEQKRQLLANKMIDILRAGVHVSDAEIEDHFRYEHERVTIRYIRVRREQFFDKVQVPDAEQVSFFEENKEQFREPEKVAIRYLAFRPETFESGIEPTEEQLQVYYDEQRASWDTPEQVRARHILLRAAADATEEDTTALRQRAVDIRKRALEGEDFADLAREFSEDSTASAGGDLGYFGRGVMTAPFEEAAFALQPGEISDIVQTQFGLHIIRVDDRKEAHTRTLEEVRDEIRSAVQKREARKVTLSKVEEAFEKLLDGSSFADVGAEFGIAVEETEPFAQSGLIPNLGYQPKIAETAFALDENELSEIMNLDNGYIVFSVARRIASRIPPFEEIRDKVGVAALEARATAAAIERAEELLSKLREDPEGDIFALAEREGIEADESGEAPRFGTGFPRLGAVPELKEIVFSLTAENRIAPKVYRIEGDAVIATLGQRIPAPADDFEINKPVIEQRVRQQRESAAISEYLAQLRESAKLELGPGYSIG